MSLLQKPFRHENERTIPKGECLGDIQVSEPRSGWACKSKIEASGERTIPKGEGPGDLQVSEPRSGRVAHRRSLSYVEERFYPITKILDFAANRNRNGFLEWAHK
ncbi:MAG: hypothetical protein EA411_06765 [Saprospirales bacterium]|nr:MAG: hypothetical protein EA411_06765 [Saprospirales bacterium]